MDTESKAYLSLLIEKALNKTLPQSTVPPNPSQTIGLEGLAIHYSSFLDNSSTENLLKELNLPQKTVGEIGLPGFRIRAYG